MSRVLTGTQVARAERGSTEDHSDRLRTSLPPFYLDVKRLHIERPSTLLTMEDEVDRLVGAWRRERPDLDVEPLEVLSRVSRLARHLDRARRLTFTEHNLEPWEFDVLTSLRRAGAPYQLSPGQLLTQTLVTSGTMTNRIDRLAKRSLVERLPDPSDRRGVLVRLTAEGRDRADEALAGLLIQERALLAELSRAQRAELAGLLRQLTAPFDNVPG
jgi:DNA-binding MarR family transcriptional regulator